LPRNQFSRYKECRCCFLLSFRNSRADVTLTTKLHWFPFFLPEIPSYSDMIRNASLLSPNPFRDFCLFILDFLWGKMVERKKVGVQYHISCSSFAVQFSKPRNVLVKNFD
jgi:hypothetical protein